MDDIVRRNPYLDESKYGFLLCYTDRYTRLLCIAAKIGLTMLGERVIVTLIIKSVNAYKRLSIEVDT